MNLLTDENLVALADGEVTPEERLVMERQLAGNGEARRHLLLLRLSGSAMREAFQLPAADPDSVAARNLRPNASQALIATASPCSRWLRRSSAVAAILMLGAFTAMGVLLTRQPSRDASAHPQRIAVGPLPQGELTRLLDRAPPEGAFAPASSAHTGFLIVASMRDRQGNPCHEVHHQGSVQQPSAAGSTMLVACRSERLGWSVVGAVARVASATDADGEHEQRARAALEEVITMIGARRAVASNEEEHEKK